MGKPDWTERLIAYPVLVLARNFKTEIEKEADKYKIRKGMRETILGKLRKAKCATHL